MNKPRYKKNTKGSAYIEFALVFPIIIGITLFVIDIARYVFILSVLNAAAALGVDYAVKLDIGVYVDRNYCGASPANLILCNKYRARAVAVADKAVNVALLATSTNVDSLNRLLPQTMFSSEGYDTYQPVRINPISSYAALIRPGETSLYNHNNTFFDHSTLLPKRVSGPGMPTISTVGGWDQVFLLHPVLVNLQAEMKCFTPFVGPWLINATQLAYKKPISKNPSALPSDLNPLDPSPTVTPITGGTGPPGPSGSGQPTPTPMPTPTLGPAPNCGSPYCSMPCFCQQLQCPQFCNPNNCPPCDD